MKYKEWLKEWLDYSVGSSTKKRTKALYASIVESHLSNLGECEMDELSPIVLQQFVSVLLKSGNARTGQGLSANYVNLIITVLQNSLKSAYDMGLSSVYTAGKIRRPKVPENRVTCFSAAEQRRIESTILGGKSQRLYGVILCLYTGLRIGELLALTWNDVDFRQRSLAVNKTCYYMKDDSGKFMRMTDTPKTETSTRVIPIPSQITPLLREWKKKSRSPYLVANGKKPITVRSYQRSFKILLKRLGLPIKGFHALRHTFATRALECGMDVKTLSEILGHKNPTITLKRYVHSFMEHKRTMMNRIGKLISMLRDSSFNKQEKDA